jgi:alkaline phosphatase D
MTRLTRRALIASAPILAVTAPAKGASLARGAFTHGVASGDPTSSAVILWTRFLPETAGAATIGWEVAEDETFRRILARGEAVSSPFDDHCVKVDAQGLPAGRQLAYRFASASGFSATGRTRTAPAGDVPSLTLALFSCANLPFGYFRAYAEAAKRDDLDLCIHTGDYIYEYQVGTYPSAAETVPGRPLDPATEIVSLSDYHRRYANYRADPDLQELHRVAPFACIWDDHELTNDAYWDGAQNHQPDKEGAWIVRRMAAAKAYADWMPMRRQSDWLHIYRTLDWGTLASIVLLDTRLIGREKQLDWRTALSSAADADALGVAAQAYMRDAIAAPSRTLLGRTQEDWMRAQLRRSKARGATWQVLAQQLVVGNQMFSPDIAALLADTASSFSKQWAAAGATIGRLGYGWNLDAWSGYVAARQRFLQSCAGDAANALVLSGDSHCAWANNLPGGRDGRPAAIEVAGTSVTSGGFERTFVKGTPEERARAFVAANPELAWCDVTHRGFAVVKLTRAGVETQWIAFENVLTRDAPVHSVTVSRAEATRAHGVGAWHFA